MNQPSVVKFCAVLLVVMLTATPPVFACSQCCRVCSPGPCPQIFYDNYFHEECAWEFGGGTQRVSVNGNVVGELYGIGSIAQEITPGDDNELRFDLTVVAGSGDDTNRIAVEVVSSGGTLLETLDTITTSGTYDYDVGDYTSYGTIKIRFRMLMMPDPGDTVYRIDNAHFWAY